MTTGNASSQNISGHKLHHEIKTQVKMDTNINIRETLIVGQKSKWNYILYREAFKWDKAWGVNHCIPTIHLHSVTVNIWSGFGLVVVVEHVEPIQRHQDITIFKYLNGINNITMIRRIRIRNFADNKFLCPRFNISIFLLSST